MHNGRLLTFVFFCFCGSVVPLLCCCCFCCLFWCFGSAWQGPFPTPVATVINAVRSAFAQGRSADTIVMLSDAISAAEADGAGHAVRAVLHMHMGSVLYQGWRLDESAAHFRRSADLAPGYPEALNGLGVIQLANGDVDGAVSSFQAALKTEPTHSNALFNLGRALEEVGRVPDAAAAYSSTLQLPPLGKGLEAVVCVALAAPVLGDGDGVDDVSRRTVVALGNALVGDRWLTSGTFLAATGGVTDGDALWAQVRAIRSATLFAVNSLSVMLGKTTLNRMLECTSILRRYAQVAGEDAAVQDHLARRRAAAAQRVAAAASPINAKPPGVHVVVQVYYTANDERREELAHCLRANLDNPHVTAVHVLAESQRDLETALQYARLAAFPHRRPKLVTLVVGSRLTYEIAFAYANEHLAGAVVALANADVYFDHTLEVLADATTAEELLPTGDAPATLLAVLRWEQTPWGTLRWVPRADSQDAWLFRAPLNLPDAASWRHLGVSGVVARHQAGTSPSPFAFSLGSPRCDLRLAQVLHEAGVSVRNPTLYVHVVHVHATGGRDYSDSDQVVGEGKLVSIAVVL